MHKIYLVQSGKDIYYNIMDWIRQSNFPENFLYEYTQRNPRIIKSSGFELLEGVNYAISTLPKKEQEVITLRYVEKLTFKEIASILNMSNSYPCKILQTSLDKLRQEPIKNYILYGLGNIKINS